MIERLRIFLPLFVFGLCIGMTQSPVNAATSAATPKAPSGVTISPTIQDITIEENDVAKEFTLTLTNNTSQSTQFKLSMVDFGSLNETGGILLKGLSAAELSSKYGLAKWVEFQDDLITIGPKSEQKVTASITNLATLSPGGHYGAVLIEPVVKNDEPQQNKIGVNPVSTSLVFVKKINGAVYKLDLSKPTLKLNPFKLPENIDLSFKNTGNVYVVPRGVVTITDSRGQIVSKGIINEESGAILPESSRKFSVSFSQVNVPSLPGKYSLHVQYRFDGKDDFSSYKQNFTYIGLPALLIGMLLALAVYFGLRHRNRISRTLVRVAGKSKKALRRLYHLLKSSRR